MSETRVCTCCERDLPITDYYQRHDCRKPGTRRSRCRWCYMAGQNKLRKMFISLKGRCKHDGIEFNLTPEDIEVPEFCPVLGIKLVFGWDSMERGYRDSSPSVDRLDNSRGYVKGNVIVVSHRANRLRSDASLDEIRKILSFYERVLSAHERGDGAVRAGASPSERPPKNIQWEQEIQMSTVQPSAQEQAREMPLREVGRGRLPVQLSPLQLPRRGVL